MQIQASHAKEEFFPWLLSHGLDKCFSKGVSLQGVTSLSTLGSASGYHVGLVLYVGNDAVCRVVFLQREELHYRVEITNSIGINLVENKYQASILQEEMDDV